MLLLRKARAPSPGVITARVQSDLGFRVPGKVTKRLVDVGQVVRTGQPLMRIDITDYAHAITTQAENVAAVKARAEQAAADEARYRGLVSTGAVSASTYDLIKATADSAQAQLAAAKAQETIARDQGDYSVLLADSDGTVVETLAEPGQVVSAGQTVVKLAHAGPREAAVYLPETIRPAMGEVVRATLYGATASVPARLTTTLRLRRSRNTDLRGSLCSPGTRPRKAPLGATVTIQIPIPRAIDSVAVPNAAITDRGERPRRVGCQQHHIHRFLSPSQNRTPRRRRCLHQCGIRPEERSSPSALTCSKTGQRVRTAAKEAIPMSDFEIQTFRRLNRSTKNKGFNLSALAVRERSVTLFFLIAHRHCWARSPT